MSHKKWTVQSIVLVALLLLAVITAQAGPLAAPTAPPGSTHFVNDSGDESDANPGNGVCETAIGNGVCTLRAAIEETNAWTGSNWIYFDSSVSLIRPDSRLPNLNDSSGGTTIRGNPTWIWGVSAGDVDGLWLEHNNKIQGLFITGFSKNGVVVVGDDNIIGTNGDGANDENEGNVISDNGGNGVFFSGDLTGNRVAGNLIGLTFDGTGDAGNALSGIKIETWFSDFGGAHSNLIGTNGDGTSDELERNVISGNDEYGILITGLHTEYNVVAGNYIGTNAAGDAEIPNATGVRITDGAMYNRIGTDGDGTADELERNVISGNDFSGVSILGLYADSNEVAGNYIGTNAAGDAHISNKWGMRIEDGASDNRIGPDNVISGNVEAGVYITGLEADYNVVAGNYIGTNAAGNAGIYVGSYSVGVQIDDGAKHNLIGTDGDGSSDELERNVISGNGSTGVRISGASTEDNVIAGNYIGTRDGGYVRLYNNTGVAIEDMAQNNLIGTDGDGILDELERNIISGNSCRGVRLYQSTGNVIAGNYIGTDASGSGDLGNGCHGVEIAGSFGNTIGGTTGSVANHIAFNDNDGIYVVESFSDDNSYDNNLRGNVIFANGDLGIDLSPDGVTPNDLGDGDSGSNNLQNYPVLSSATINGSLITIQGTLNSISSTTYKLDFYVNGSCDSSGYGEGRTYLGAKTVTTDTSGNASFTAAFINFLPAGTYVTATATDPDGNTSEFSQCLALVSIGKPHIIVKPLALNVTLLSGDTGDHAPDATLASSDTITRTLAISNTGSSDLVWSLDESPDVRWMNQSPTSGTIAPGSSADVTVSFSAADSLGTHITMLRITSNDPDEGTVEVSTTLAVEEVSSYIYLPLIIRSYD